MGCAAVSYPPSTGLPRLRGEVSQDAHAPSGTFLTGLFILNIMINFILTFLNRVPRANRRLPVSCDQYIHASLARSLRLCQWHPRYSFVLVQPLANKKYYTQILKTFYIEYFQRQPELVSGGLEMQQCGRVHFKDIIMDGTASYMGSAKFSGEGMGAQREEARNFELGILTSDPSLVRTLAEVFAISG